MKNSILRGMVVLGAMVSFSTTAMADHRWGNYHWANKERSGIVLQVVDSVTGFWRDDMVASLNAWNQSTKINTVVDLKTTDDSIAVRNACSMVDGQVRICNDSYGENGWLGIATIGITRIKKEVVITQGSVKINDYYSQYWDTAFTHTALDGSYGDTRRNHVMCQEIGHVFGLGHTSEDGSSQGTCMDYSWADGTQAEHNNQNSEWPNAHDYDLLDNIIYDHYDRSNSYDTGTDSEPEPDGGTCNAPPGKGCNKGSNAGPTPLGVLVHSAKAYELWVANRPGGGLWIHHVRLVNDEVHDHHH